jgi:hypothetical protein
MKIADILAGLIAKNQKMWLSFGNYETKILSKKLSAVNITEPIYISGLARSGSTILLEAISSNKNIATHKYRDFPMLFTPFVWNKLFMAMDKVSPQHQAIERSHKDRITVTPNSPEAMEEMIWNVFFDHLHNENVSNMLDGNTGNTAFEKFYREHIQKMLLVENKHRYASKANYNITRILYLLKIFPDAKFVITIRNPVNHIASIIKQDTIFKDIHQKQPDTLRHMQFSGHYEFGLQKKLINTDVDNFPIINQLFVENKNIEAWAYYWQQIYAYLYDITQMNLPNVIMVRYEDLCRDTESELEKIFTHCNLKLNTSIISHYNEKISLPEYYKPQFNSDELAQVQAITGHVAIKYGY